MTTNGREIAIIGSGMSGLLAAHHARAAGFKVTVFEQAARWGGNVYTRALKLDTERGEIDRWCDMGVNDFNATKYVNIVALLDRLGIVPLSLQNTCSFRDTTGTTRYTIEADGSSTMDQDLNDAYERFKKEAPGDAKLTDYKHMSIGEYLRAKYGATPLFGPHVIFPRVNGMYFNADIGPFQMPFVSVMAYYGLQEGFPDSEADRKYFPNGASEFVKKLCAKLEKDGPGEWPGEKVTFTRVYPGQCRVDADKDGVTVLRCDRPPYQGVTPLGRFSDAVLAVPTYDAMRAIRTGVTQDMVSVASEIDYYSSVAYAHTSEGCMPPVDERRTYNIHIHDGYQALLPYTISYVVNFHQNDAANPAYRDLKKQFFCTLNPRQPIPDDDVLRGPVDDENFEPMVKAFFPHNAGTFRTLRAQARLWSVPDGDGARAVQGQNHLYFTGGWTNGAGLMEQCFESAEGVVKRLQNRAEPLPWVYDPEFR